MRLNRVRNNHIRGCFGICDIGLKSRGFGTCHKNRRRKSYAEDEANR